MPLLTRLPVARSTRAATATRPFPHGLAAGGLIAFVAALNLVYLASDCPLELAPDEAHYWQWSRHLDWSYYSKGPLVAWLIRGSCELFGDLSVRLVGTEMLAVRLPVVASHAALLAGLYVLTSRTLRSSHVALALVAVAAAMPAVGALGVFMTIDPPFLACWCWALVFLHAAIVRGEASAWLLAGVCSAFGILAKYPMLLLPAALVGFLLLRRRAEFRRKGVWLFLAITALGCVPILVWNAAHEWVSFRHVFGQAGVGGVKPAGFQWLGPLAFVGGHAGLLLGVGFVAFAAAAWRFRKTSDAGLSLLWWASVPVWGVFLVASVRAKGQINWPAAAYIGWAVLGAAWVRDELAHPAAWRRRLTAGTLGTVVAVGVILSGLLHFPGSFRPLLAQYAGEPTEANPVPVRKLDPTVRLHGWRTLAAEVDHLRDEVRRETGQDAVVAGMVWTTPGELAFYCRGHPEVYSAGLALSDRHSQHDLWRPNPVADAQAFRGRTFVYVGDVIPEGTFDRLSPPVTVVHSEGGVPVAAWTVYVAHGFRGFPAVRPAPGRPGY